MWDCELKGCIVGTSTLEKLGWYLKDGFWLNRVKVVASCTLLPVAVLSILMLVPFTTGLLVNTHLRMP